MENKIKLYHGDCLEKLKLIEDKSINLVLIDPPYNISKADWDKWETVDKYIDFMGKVFLEIQRVLKDNGSFYFWHNDFIQITKLQQWVEDNTNFIFNGFNVWVKPKFRALTWKNPSDKNKLRSWFPITEYCLFYTFQDDEHSRNASPFKREIIDKRKKLGLSTIQVAEMGKFYKNVNHGGSVSNWEKGANIPTKEQFETLKEILPIDSDYETLLKEYDESRYTHNLDENHNNVWMSNEHNSGKLHPTQKPIDLLERIIKTSSNEGDVVLDCFMGSGSTGVAALDSNRRFIGIEKDDKYFDIAKNRINQIMKDEETNKTA
ncbi:site-specific DNA-methyltransferase [Clostridium perfringens]|uniref:site-specific DNA-methyltransferase n=1 Tax=Clostridium perfringens TaxID=1502 RepID=UPI00096AAFE4|nr:site-specific DNA-methyltransferase [Clostridium perfringens]